MRRGVWFSVSVLLAATLAGCGTVNTSFSPVVNNALTQVHTSFPLMAPTLPGYSPKGRGDLGAQAKSGANSYEVNLQWANHPLPVNSPALSQPPNTGEAMFFGSFGGIKYASNQVAMAHLYTVAKGDIAPAYLPFPVNIHPKQVDLGYGVQGLAFAVPNPMVVWNIGGWRLEVTDANLAEDIREAKKLVTYIHSNLLPETYGVFGVNIAGDGNHTSVKWVYGNVVYSCSDDHSAMQAVKMLISMRVYPDGSVKP